ncbi:MAG: hypothetical protein M1438_07625 [Deltaproteobacteria bacterium]|nr:hypothetical protein [Deltaproteobacteria bacterium]
MVKKMALTMDPAQTWDQKIFSIWQKFKDHRKEERKKNNREIKEGNVIY